jgi:hypothetical protein
LFHCSKRAAKTVSSPPEMVRLCRGTLRVEIDHIVPRVRGGTSTPDNLRILCRTVTPSEPDAPQLPPAPPSG